ncbi:DNA alkylation repair protein [Paenibacillus lemnae]|uniref:DNA alkylation repair protein n=1 Tax=Paenibacillus lemnae TaxID=1330551 RepID=A0A848MBX8_PAELE|nr:DNA alkylation repair protein [Paenibacillus lemnae]NMO97650.1 hypothetical protein [Paenibacillus lemnae]
MAEPLKDMYNEEFLLQLAQKIQSVFPAFSVESFIDNILDPQWEQKGLKERMRTITLSLGASLPSSYNEAISILLKIHPSCQGFPYLIFPDFVEVYGREKKEWDLSIRALEIFTTHSSAEFAVRPFIMDDSESMMKQMAVWSHSENEHVRRLSSEGCRPRLPWGQALVMFKKDPEPIIKILEQLKADPSLYVRKSVANNLNDIAKDHPELVLDIARRWLGSHPHTDWIVRHGCRTLIRKANPEVLSLFGYSESSADSALITHAQLEVNPSSVSIGGESRLNYEIHLREGDAARIRIEYGIDFVKSGGKVSRKAFLLSDKTVSGGAKVHGTRVHRWSNLTTRRHYPGLHRIVLLVNGQEVAATELDLLDS